MDCATTAPVPSATAEKGRGTRATREARDAREGGAGPIVAPAVARPVYATVLVRDCGWPTDAAATRKAPRRR